MDRKIRHQLIAILGAALFSAGEGDGRAGVLSNQSALAASIHGDLSILRHAVFDMRQVEKMSGVILMFSRRGAITREEIYRPVGALRPPYVDMEYERRNHGAWVGLTLAVDRRYCISPADLDLYFPMGEGVPRTSDHFAGDDFEIGFGDNDNKIWITYEKYKNGQCARKFTIEAEK